MNRSLCLLLVAALGGGACTSAANPCTGWAQWSQGDSHSGQVCVAGQTPARVLLSTQVDPFAGIETELDGALLVHYAVPLVVGDDVYLTRKLGTYSLPCQPTADGSEQACHSWDSQIWTEELWHWSDEGKLEFQWSVGSDWKPVPSEISQSEPLFQPVVVGDNLYLPGGDGELIRVDRHTGIVQATLATPSMFAPEAYVTGPLVADKSGNVYYNVVSFLDPQPANTDARGYLVRVATDDSFVAKSYDELVPTAPKGMTCHTTFQAMDPQPDLPWPPPPNADGSPVLPPLVECGSQRPGINVAPAIGADGTLFTVSRAQFSSRDSFVVAVNPDLTPKWATSLRGILNDGCGVMVPDDGDPMNAPFDCRPGAAQGVDPYTGEMPAGRIIDQSSSSPVALPDGGVLYGAYTLYNGDRGHLMKLDATGKPAGSYDFGWDYTPAVWQHDDTYSIVVKDNHYNYDPQNMVNLGPYYITQLDANMNVEWRFQSTNTKSCSYDSNHNLHCTDDHPHGFEWCINAPAIDSDGTIYAGGEDGVLYAIGQGGVDKGHLFLSMSLGSSYTPLSVDHKGRIYQQNDGILSVVGQ